MSRLTGPLITLVWVGVIGMNVIDAEAWPKVWATTVITLMVLFYAFIISLWWELHHPP